MENNESKKFYMKNHMCSYFGDIIKFEDFDFGNILLDEKLYENILIYDISYKTFIGLKLLRIMFDKVRHYEVTKYLVSFDLEKYDALEILMILYDRIR